MTTIARSAILFSMAILVACTPPPPGTTVSEVENRSVKAFGKALAREQGIGLLDYSLFGQDGFDPNGDQGQRTEDGVLFSTNFTLLSRFEDRPQAGIEAGLADFCAKKGGTIVQTPRETLITTRVRTRQGYRPISVAGTFDFCGTPDDRALFGYRILNTRERVSQRAVRYLLTTAEPVSDQSAIQAFYETMKVPGEGISVMTEAEKQLRAREFDDIAFGDQLCLLTGRADVFGIVENKAKGRFQLRIQKSNDQRYAIGNLVWGEQQEWGDCGLLAYR